MSFIDDSEKNVNRLIETTAAGGVAGFVGRGGRDIDTLFSGPFHPDSGHGSENEKLLQKNKFRICYSLSRSYCKTD